MPITDALYRDLDLAKHEVASIHADAQALAKAIEQLLQDFIDRRGGDFEEVWKGINDSLADLTDAVSKDAVSRMERLQDRINRIEDADLRRSTPVLL